MAFCYLFDRTQPVKLSDSLVLEARVTSEFAQRSIAGQIEFSAGLGRAVEVLLRSPEVAVLKKNSTTPSLAKALAMVGTPTGNQRVTNFLQEQPFPHYQPAERKKGFLVRIDEDGTRTLGRFVQRKFIPSKVRNLR